MSSDKTAIRDAATVVVLRDRSHDPKVLMGQRGAQAAFMPNKFVFPGGAVDSADADVGLASSIAAPCAQRLAQDCAQDISHALSVAAIRELWEETGLILGAPGDWPGQPHADWTGFAARTMRPAAAHLQFIFRAITPPGRPRRFDARFFMLDADHIAGDLDDFSAASDELSHLQWVPLAKARHEYDLPFITEVVLAEVEANLGDASPPASVPFFRNDDEASLFLRLRGYAPRSDD
ncbi:MAG: DNA mismatch repair protein MutT [Roseovarius sp.]